ncbi:MAG TPA: AAA family ATPase [Myxococcota bacterium]|nr:AAA family ATPase [Myxococcota bacterium]
MICSHCGSTPPLGARRCEGCGAALESACVVCASEVPSDAAFCPYCGRRVSRAASTDPSHRALARGERRRATVLFSDLWGYTALAEAFDPEEVAAVMNRLKESATHVIEDYGGTVNQFVGDQVMALFGIPIAHEDDPARAVRAAFELHRVVRALGDELAPRLGQRLCLHTAVNTGLVISQRRDARDGVFGVIGDVINTGARLIHVSGEDEIVVGPETRRAIEPYFDGEDMGPVSLRGKAAAVSAWRVLRPRADSRFEAARQRGLSSFTGRERELARLQRHLRESREGRLRFVAVRGEPGVGKSRLFHEFERALSREGVIVARGRCPSYGTVAPYRAFLDVVRQSLGIGEAGPGALEDGTRLAPELAPHLPVYLHLLSIRSESHPLPRALQGEALREAVLDALAALVASLTKRAPVALLLEDWHWADDASERALRHLVEGLGGEPVLVLINYRPNYRTPWGGLAPTIVDLAPLDAGETHAFVSSLLGAAAGDELASRVHRHTEGNPLFIEELCRSLAEESQEPVFPFRRPGLESDELDVPATIAAVLRARVDRLDRDAAEVLRVASVLGDEFSSRVLGRLVAEPETLEGALGRLRAADLVLPFPGPREPTFRFKHALIRDAAYETLLLRRRRELHAEAARALEAHVGRDGLDAHCEQLAHHYARSDERELAVFWLDRSGDKAVASGAMIQGLEHYRNAVAALDALEPSEERMRRRIDLTLKLANAAIYRPSLESVRVLERSHAYAERLGETRGVVRTLYWMGWLEHALGRWNEAVPHFERCTPLAKQLGDEKLLAQLSSNMGQVYFYAGEYARAVSYLETAIRLRRGIEGGRAREPIIAYSTGFLAMIDAEAGVFDRAYARAEEALALACHAGPQIEGALASILAVVQLFRGDWARCRATADALRPRAERIGSTYMLSMSRNVGGYAAFRQGQHEVGLRLLRESVRSLESSDVRMAISLNYACLGEALALAGDAQEAELWARKAIARASAGDRLGEAQGHRALALAALAHRVPDVGLAEERFAASCAVAQAKGSRRDLAISRLFAAESLPAAPASRASRCELEELAGELDAMGMEGERERARALLAARGSL